MGLKGPQVRMVWMKSDVPAISIIRVAQAQPIVRCGKRSLRGQKLNGAEADRGESERA